MRKYNCPVCGAVMTPESRRGGGDRYCPTCHAEVVMESAQPQHFMRTVGLVWAVMFVPTFSIIVARFSPGWTALEIVLEFFAGVILFVSVAVIGSIIADWRNPPVLRAASKPTAKPPLEM